MASAGHNNACFYDTNRNIVRNWAISGAQMDPQLQEDVVQKMGWTTEQFISKMKCMQPDQRRRLIYALMRTYAHELAEHVDGVSMSRHQQEIETSGETCPEEATFAYTKLFNAHVQVRKRGGGGEKFTKNTENHKKMDEMPAKNSFFP
jgi:hypothetical protein